MMKSKNNSSIRVSQGKYNFYMSTLPSSILKKICYISRKDENKIEGFQRLLNEPRAKLIQKYYEDGGAIPAPIILSAKENAGFKFENNKISFLEKEKSFLIIDGQHRFYAIDKLEKSIDIPVVIFDDLSVNATS